MSYVTEQVEQFYKERDMIPVIIPDSPKRLIHQYEAGPKYKGILCRSKDQPRAIEMARGNNLLLRHCPGCENSFLTKIINRRAREGN